METLRNDRGYRIEPLDFEPIIIYTKSDCSTLHINAPLFTLDNSQRYTLGALDYFGQGHNLYARLLLLPEQQITAD